MNKLIGWYSWRILNLRYFPKSKQFDRVPKRIKTHKFVIRITNEFTLKTLQKRGREEENRKNSSSRSVITKSNKKKRIQNHNILKIFRKPMHKRTLLYQSKASSIKSPFTHSTLKTSIRFVKHQACILSPCLLKRISSSKMHDAHTPPLPPFPSRKNRCSNSSATSLHSTRKRFFFVRRWLAPSSFLYSIVLTRDGRSSSRANPAGFLGYERGYWNFENPPRRCGQRRLCIRKKSLETAARFRPSSLSLSLSFDSLTEFSTMIGYLFIFILSRFAPQHALSQ